MRGTYAELNLEGAALHGGELLLLQRGSRKNPRNALLHLARGDFDAALERGVFDPATPPRATPVDLSVHDGLPWTFTDLAVRDDGSLLASVVLEDTDDAYADGDCHGSALACLSPDGTLHWLRRLDLAGKVEGVAVDSDRAWLVTDADDRAVPARLLRVTLP